MIWTSKQNCWKKICFGLVLFIVTNVYGQLPKTGLYFYAHQSNIDKRTSLILNDGDPYSLREHGIFTLEFDAYLREETVKFGYFFRIISNKEEAIDLVVNNDKNLFLVVNNRDFQLTGILATEQWNRFKIIFDKKENLITLNFHGEVINCPYDLSDTNTLLVHFGCCDFQGLGVHDVAPMILKDVAVGINGKPVHFWALKRHGENVVYDDLLSKPAIALNPSWIKDFGIFWHKETEIQTTLYPQVAFDSIQNRVIILNPDSYTTYSVSTGKLQTIPITGFVPHNKYSNQLLFNPVSKRLISYSIEGKKIFAFDETTHTWHGGPMKYREDTHAHHNSYISPLDSSMYLFGGYGFYAYKSDFFKVDLPSGASWEKSDLSHTIIPRYLAAMGGNKAGNKLYVYGGRGAKMGRQELGPRNFSDFYEIDLKTLAVRYLYDLSTKYKQEEDNVYSNNLILDEQDSCFYVLGFPNKAHSWISLEKHSMLHPNVEILADTIPFYFRDNISLCNLFYSPHLSKLVAVVSSSTDGDLSTLSIYSLDYPPLKKEDVLQATTPPLLSSKALLFLSIFIIVTAIVSTIIWLRFKKKQLPEIKNDKQSVNKTNEPDVEKTYYLTTEKSILFFGGFQVFDKNGKNLTGEFTPTLKYMLVLILLYSLKNKKGISSAKLQEFLWFDKSEDAARNNRNVNLRKLRVLLQDVGNIEITNENGYWTMAIPPAVFSDYQESLRLIETIQSSDQSNIEDILRLVELLTLGPMLPNIQMEWVDSFKNDFSNAVIDVLLHYLNHSGQPYTDNLSIRLKVAESVLKFDPISEEAIGVKCNTLYKMGKKGLAKAAFDNFSKEYKTLLGETYQGSLKVFLDKN